MDYCAVVAVIDEVASLLFRRAFLRFEGLYPFDVLLAWSIICCIVAAADHSFLLSNQCSLSETGEREAQEVVLFFF